MTTSEPVTWKAVLLLLASSIGVSAVIMVFTVRAFTAPLADDLDELKQLSGQLGNLSSSNAASREVMESLRRDLDRNVRAIERLEEKLP